VLTYVLDGVLRLASPVMPFVTEEIWQKLPHHPDWDRPQSLIVAKFPKAEALPRFTDDAANWQKVQDLISGIRSLRSQAGIAPKVELQAFVRAEEGLAGIFEGARDDIQRLAKLSAFSVSQTMQRPGQCMVAV